MLIGVSSTPSGVAKAWITAHCPTASASPLMSRITPTRVTCGPDLHEQFEPFTAQPIFELGEAGHVAAWPRQACDVAAAYRINALGHHDRYCAGGLAQHRNGCAHAGHDNVRTERNQVRSMLAQSRNVTAAPQHSHLHITPDRPPSFLQ